MFQILIFTVVCVIVVYACIAFRDDRPVIDPWNDTFKQCDQTHSSVRPIISPVNPQFPWAGAGQQCQVNVEFATTESFDC